MVFSYAAVSVLATLIHYALFIVLISGLGAPIASALAGIVAACFAYILLARYVFVATGHYRFKARRFSFSAILSNTVNTSAMYILSTLLHWHPYIAQLLSTLLAFLFGFCVNFLWAYARQE